MSSISEGAFEKAREAIQEIDMILDSNLYLKNLTFQFKELFIGQISHKLDPIVSGEFIMEIETSIATLAFLKKTKSLIDKAVAEYS